MRKRILTVCVSVLVLLLGIGAVTAYLADADQKENPFSVGENTITPEEEFEPPAPGKKTVKSPKAVNTGTVACYVRAQVLLTDSRAHDYLTYYNGANTGMNTKDWKTGTDGWMYYQKAIAPKEQTLPVFTHIQMKENFPKDLDVGIDVIFESVQTDGFTDAESAFVAVEGNRKGK